jgi:succinylarginine dihydrolase
MWLVAPADCQESEPASAVIRRIVEGENPISGVEFVDVRQSMRNGGGPACLRLRVVLTEEELEVAHARVFLTAELYERLVGWVVRHYRDELGPGDLGDVKLLEESRAALEELTGILGLGSVYAYQRSGVG